MTLSLSALALCADAPAQQQLTEWKLHKTDDGLHPSPEEQRMLWLMNRARTNPLAEGLRLGSLGNSIIDAALALFKTNIVKMKLEFSLIPAAAPAAFDNRLYEASRQHSAYMIAVNQQTHDGQNAKLNAAPIAWTTARLSIFGACDDGLECHAALNIDYGPGTSDGMQSPRGHRDAIMSNLGLATPNLSSVGLAMVPCARTANVGPYCFSAAYAALDDSYVDHYNRFIVGTVWNDLNKNGQYDPGEGLSGIRVGLDRRNFYAVTGVAGGYAFPVEVAGNYTVNFSGPGIPETLFKPVTVGAVSALVDAELSSFVAAAPPPMASSLRLNSDGSFRLLWSGGTPPYQVQRCENPAGPWINLGSPTMEVTANVERQGTKGFFRVVSSD